MHPISNFTVIESVYGKIIVNRHCSFQAEALIKTGRTHIEAELAKIFQIIDRLPEDAIIIDGGANIGFFSIPVAQRLKAKQTRIISFEPQRQLFYALSGSVALNDLTYCFVRNAGLGDAIGTASVPTVDYSKPADFGMVMLQKDTSAEKPPAVLDENTIQIVTIDSLKLPRLDFIKLDVEGYESQAITGGLESIRTFRPFLWVEYFLIGQDTVKNALSSIPDYDFYIMDRQNMLCAPKEKMQSLGLAIQATDR